MARLLALIAVFFWSFSFQKIKKKIWIGNNNKGKETHIFSVLKTQTNATTVFIDTYPFVAHHGYPWWWTWSYDSLQAWSNSLTSWHFPPLKSLEQFQSFQVQNALVFCFKSVLRCKGTRQRYEEPVASSGAGIHMPGWLWFSHMPKQRSRKRLKTIIFPSLSHCI